MKWLPSWGLPAKCLVPLGERSNCGASESWLKYFHAKKEKLEATENLWFLEAQANQFAMRLWFLGTVKGILHFSKIGNVHQIPLKIKALAKGLQCFPACLLCFKIPVVSMSAFKMEQLIFFSQIFAVFFFNQNSYPLFFFCLPKFSENQTC